MAYVRYFVIRGIAPPEVARAPEPLRLAYWQAVADLGLRRKDWELSRGFNARGKPMPPVKPETQEHRKSAMAGVNSWRLTGPYLMPARKLSRTRSLLTAQAFPNHVRFSWAFDPHTGDSWARILDYHARRGRAYDVIGLSPLGLAWVKREAEKRWYDILANGATGDDGAAAVGAAGVILKRVATPRVAAKSTTNQTAAGVPAGFPASLDGLKKLRKLGGSTGATLVEDPSTGARYVLKTGEVGHMQTESAADAIYRLAGADAPETAVYATPNGAARLATYIEGRTLGSLKRKSDEFGAAASEIRRHAVLDALIGNRDVLGVKYDNIIVTPDGRVFRVDNGGSMSYFPDGRKKAVSRWAGGDPNDDLSEMRSPVYGTSDVYGGLTDDQAREQAQRVLSMRDVILNAARPEDRDALRARLDKLARP